MKPFIHQKNALAIAACLSIVAAQFFVVLQLANAGSTSSNAATLQPLGLYDAHSRVDTVQCGANQIVVTTTWLTMQKDLGDFALNQTVAFLKPTLLKPTIVQYIHHYTPATPVRIWRVSCVPIKARQYVQVESTNGGNCHDGCEWSDIFETDGVYVASSKGKAQDGNFIYKPLQGTLFQTLLVRWGANPSASVDIPLQSNQ